MIKKEDVYVIFEGMTEEKFLKFLNSNFNSKYNIILINADGKEKIIKKYKQQRKMHSYSKFILMYDLDFIDTIESIKGLYDGVELKNTLIYFVNPKFELILALIKKNNPNINKLNKEIETIYSVEEYSKKEQQVNKIIRQINKEDLFSLFKKLRNISTDDTVCKSTNYLELFQYLYEIKID